MARKRKFDDGGEVEMESGSGGYGEAPEMKAEPEKPKTFKEAFAEARAAGDKTFTWNGKKYTTEVAGSKAPSPVSRTSSSAPAPAPASRAASSASSEDEYSGRARLQKMFGTAEGRANVKPDIKASDIAAAKKAGMEREARNRADLFGPATTTLKKIGARMGPQSMRDQLKAEGYAKGGMTASKRADGIAQRGKTRGTIVACGGGYMKGKK